MEILEIKQKLQEVQDDLHKQFNGFGAQDRMNQFDGVMETLKMVVDHLFDEASRMGGYRG